MLGRAGLGWCPGMTLEVCRSTEPSSIVIAEAHVGAVETSRARRDATTRRDVDVGASKLAAATYRPTFEAASPQLRPAIQSVPSTTSSST